MNKILLIGCGHMGSALLDAWLGLKLYSFDVVDPFNFKILNKKYLKNNVRIFKETPTQIEIKKYDIIIFAIKPQVANKVIAQYKNFEFKKNSVIASIIAGKKILFFKELLIFFQLLNIISELILLGSPLIITIFFICIQ